MTRGVYYNEFDPRAAAWLRALIARGLIPAGEVDERSIADVAADDLRGFTQHHFFAGIAGWSRALQLAGWPADRPIWTGSCPCQPFSVAGKGKGTTDERHVWPDFFRLIGECRPAVVVGEQVSSSFVIGRKQKVQNLRVGSVVRSLQEAQQRRISRDMSGLRKFTCQEREAMEIRNKEKIYETQERGGSGFFFGQRGQAESQEEEFAIRFELERSSASDKSGVLRSNKRTIRPFDAKIVERSLFGQDRQLEGLYEGQRESGSLCGEHDGQRLGTTNDTEDSGPYSEGINEFVGNDSQKACSEVNWFDGMCNDLESAHYSVGASVLSACSVNAPHIRQRLYWVALADAEGLGRRGRAHDEDEGRRQQPFADTRARSGDMADADDAGRERWQLLPERPDERAPWSRGVEWRRGADGKERRVKSGVRLLVDGVPNRVGRLRGYGNAIVPPLAAEVIGAIMEIMDH